MKIPLLLPLFLMLLFFSNCRNDASDMNCGTFHCENGGTCVQNACQCKLPYTGLYCDQEKIPSSIRVVNVKVLNYPLTNSAGESFDYNRNVDIYIGLYYRDNAIYIYPDHYSEADPNKVYDFQPKGNVNLLHPTDLYSLALFDKDDDPDDLIGEVDFMPYEEGNNFPIFKKIGNPASLYFELELQYSF